MGWWRRFLLAFARPSAKGHYIVGDKGMLQVVEPWKPGIKGWRAVLFTPQQGAEVAVVTPAVDPYLCEVQAMEACVLDGAAPVVPLSLSRTFLKSVLAIYESARTGKLVEIDN